MIDVWLIVHPFQNAFRVSCIVLVILVLLLCVPSRFRVLFWNAFALYCLHFVNLVFHLLCIHLWIHRMSKSISWVCGYPSIKTSMRFWIWIILCRCDFHDLRLMIMWCAKQVLHNLNITWLCVSRIVTPGLPRLTWRHSYILVFLTIASIDYYYECIPFKCILALSWITISMPISGMTAILALSHLWFAPLNVSSVVVLVQYCISPWDRCVSLCTLH